jgi:hypothetical protein
MNNIEQFKKIATELGELYDKKNTAYNNSFGDTYKKLGIISAVTRISDKYNRLCNLATNPDIDNLGESLEDTLRDMASYCIMTVMELENAKPIGLEMQGNILKRGNISYQCSIEIPEDAPVLAMFREEDRKIYKGDVFECIEHVVMEDGDVAYRKNKAYVSEKDGCITDDEHDENHNWDIQEDDEENWWHYFKRI